MRTKGSFKYGADSEEKMLAILDSKHMSTRAITFELRKNIFPKIGRNTVARLLNKLKDSKKIKGERCGKFILWWKN
jgi:Fe2+ or Zn2+ uptake regulation protein